ncbi:hypothetical protein QFC20_003170 [Naganishia adeliensis]|uniref:Uncharacterized protein n=1 Tax=Naganishia adeliensis TaxID=92952 RepID=A0ACC2WF60_9TREE|nr:hypothetical protein QFC20_003170 [Naganishia adeliensis]
MGNCFSDPSTKKNKKDAGKGGHVLGSAPTQPAPARTNAPPHHESTELAPVVGNSSPGRMLGDGFEDSNRSNDPREMARIAAEQRIKSHSQRGVNSKNAKAGQLSAKLEAERRKPLQASSPRNEEDMFDPRRYE